MKSLGRENRIIFVFFMLAFFLVFACDINLQWPKEIEIRKQMPELTFKADFDHIELEDFFGDLDFEIADADTQKVIKCANTNTLTKIIYVKIYENSNLKNLPGYTLIDIDDEEIINDVTLVSSLPPPIKINYPAFDNSEVLKHFSINPLLSRVYLSGADANKSFLDALVVDVKINSNDKLFKRSQASGLNNVSVYSETSLPPSLNEDFFLFEDKNVDIEIEFDIVLKKGNKVSATALDGEIPILVELAIWVPYILTADNDGIELPLKEFDYVLAEDGKDLFGRKSADEESFLEYIDNFYINIIFNENPFPDSIIKIESDFEGIGETLIASSRISGQILNIPLDKNNVLFPFNPYFTVLFDKGDRIIVPNEFFIDEFAFKAGLKYNAEIPAFPEIPEGMPWEW